MNASEAEKKIDALESALERIEAWCEAYPIAVFTEPDWTEVRKRLGDTLLTQVSASNMRHVVTQIKRIIESARMEAEHGA